MLQQRTELEIEEMVQLARTYCEALAAYRYAKAGGGLAPREDEEALGHLQRLETRLVMLKSNSELDRCRAKRWTNVIQFREHQRKAAK